MDGSHSPGIYSSKKLFIQTLVLLQSFIDFNNKIIKFQWDKAEDFYGEMKAYAKIFS